MKGLTVGRTGEQLDEGGLTLLGGQASSYQ